MTGPDGSGLRAYVAGGVVINPQGEMVVVSQAGTSWSVPKGHVEDGETAIEAAVREIAEETGLGEPRLLGKLRTYHRSAVDQAGRPDERVLKTIDLFLFATERQRLAPSDPHNPEARWVPAEEAAAMLTHPADRAVVAELIPRIRRAAAGLRRTADDAVAQALRERWPAISDEFVRRFLLSSHASAKDLAAQAVLTLDKPYGVNHILVQEGEFGLSFARLLPGRSSSLHYHRQRGELFRVRRGALTLTDGERRRELTALEFGMSIPGREHAIANEGDELLEIIEVFAPALLSDKVRVSDRYDRKLGAVGVGE